MDGYLAEDFHSGEKEGLGVSRKKTEGWRVSRKRKGWGVSRNDM